MLTYATTFSGIGGWELGLDACGWELRWQCERDRFCRTVLAERFGVPIASDIATRKLFKFLYRTFGSVQASRVDVLVGSPPCQPFSVAGKKVGIADARHLYPAFIAAVRILRPRYVLMENVAGLVSNRGAFGQYLGGLAALGFDIVWHCLPASAVGANHQRDRVWIVADAGNSGIVGWRDGPGGTESTRASRQIKGRGHVPDASGDLRRASWHDGPKTSYGRGDAVRDSELPGLERWRFKRPVERADNWAVEPDVGRVADGIPFRVDQLKGLGNAVVPQIPHIIGQAINETEKRRHGFH